MEYLSPKDGGLPYSNRISWLILLFISSSSVLAAPAPIIRVMVEREKAHVRVEGFDIMISEALTNRKIAREDRRASIPIECPLGGKIEIRLGKERLRVGGPIHIQSYGGFIRVQERQYRDDLYIYSMNGDCLVVNHVDLEKYIAGLLNSEMSASWSFQALMSQAVAARTYALHQMGSAKAAFDLHSSVRDQVYEGAHKERYKALRAVQDTRGMILAYNGKPIKAFYHSTCGGQTEKAEQVWGVKYPYLRSVTCGYCDKSPRFNWLFSVNTNELEAKLKHENLLSGKLVGLKVLSRNRLGRAGEIEIQGSEATITASSIRIRDIMGSTNVRSTDFNIVRDTGKYTFIGHGSGHGVGMCQYGAKFMAERGNSYARILKHYYPAAELVKIY